MNGPVFTTSALQVSGGALVQLNLGAATFASTNTGLTLSGAGAIQKNGSGTWLLGNPGGGTVIALSSGGLIDVQGGKLSNDYGNADWSANQGTLNVATGAIVDLRNNPITVGALTGSGTVDNAYVTAQTLTVGNGNGGGVFSGTITETVGPLSLLKVGAGTQTLTGANTYTGGTTINGGTLVAAHSGQIGTFRGRQHGHSQCGRHTSVPGRQRARLL